MSKQEEIKQALAAASTDHEWDTDGTFIQWKDGHVLKGNYRQIAITQAHTPEAFNNPNHENDAHLIANAPEYIAYLLEYSERLSNGLERASQSHRYMEEELIKAQKELEEARKILGFYADAENYEEIFIPGIEEWQSPSVLDDVGKRARAYLGQEGEGNREQKA